MWILSILLLIELFETTIHGAYIWDLIPFVRPYNKKLIKIAFYVELASLYGCIYMIPPTSDAMAVFVLGHALFHTLSIIDMMVHGPPPFVYTNPYARWAIKTFMVYDYGTHLSNVLRLSLALPFPIAPIIGVAVYGIYRNLRIPSHILYE